MVRAIRTPAGRGRRRVAATRSGDEGDPVDGRRTSEVGSRKSEGICGDQPGTPSGKSGRVGPEPRSWSRRGIVFYFEPARVPALQRDRTICSTVSTFCRHVSDRSTRERSGPPATTRTAQGLRAGGRTPIAVVVVFCPEFFAPTSFARRLGSSAAAGSTFFAQLKYSAIVAETVRSEMSRTLNLLPTSTPKRDSRQPKPALTWWEFERVR